MRGMRWRARVEERAHIPEWLHVFECDAHLIKSLAFGGLGGRMDGWPIGWALEGRTLGCQEQQVLKVSNNSMLHELKPLK